MMLAAQQTKTRKAKEPKDPDKEFERRRYKLLDGRDGFPAVGFKGAIVGGARLFDGVTMTALKTQLYVHGEPAGLDLLVPIDGLCTMREDTVRVGNGVADLRYRPMYWPWKADLADRLHLRRNCPPTSRSSRLVEAGGFGGDRRMAALSTQVAHRHLRPVHHPHDSDSDDKARRQAMSDEYDHRSLSTNTPKCNCSSPSMAERVTAEVALEAGSRIRRRRSTPTSSGMSTEAAHRYLAPARPTR